MKQKEQVAERFNTIGVNHDSPYLSIFPRCADRLVALTGVQPGDTVLDVGTGTGAVAIRAARAVGSGGRVIGIDIAEVMLEQARRNIDNAGLGNVELLQMDAELPEFSDAAFDTVLCGFGIQFLPNLAPALAVWRRLVKPHGAVAFSVWGASAHLPLLSLYQSCLQRHGIATLTDNIPRAERTPERCHDLLREAGLNQIEVSAEQYGRYLPDTEAWWATALSFGFGAEVRRLPADLRERIKAEHLAEVQALASSQGIWHDQAVIFAVGRN